MRYGYAEACRLPVSPIQPSFNVSGGLADPYSERLARAVQVLNSQKIFGEESEIILRRDDQTHRLVVQVVDRISRLIIHQLPNASIFQLVNRTAR